MRRGGERKCDKMERRKAVEEGRTIFPLEGGDHCGSQNDVTM